MGQVMVEIDASNGYVIRYILSEVAVFSMASFNYICLLWLKFNRLSQEFPRKQQLNAFDTIHPARTSVSLISYQLESMGAFF